MSKPTIGIFTAKLLLPALGICLADAVERRKAFVYATIALFFAGMVTIMLAGERTAFGSTVLGFVAISLLLTGVDRKLGKFCLIIIAAIAALSAVLYCTQDFVHERGAYLFDTMLHYGDSPYGRLASAGYKLGKEHLLTGVGFKGFRELCPHVMNDTYCNIHPHNPYIEWFAETGLPGMLLFIALIAFFVYDALELFIQRWGMDKLLPAVAAGVLVVNFFPVMGTQSFFSNWPAMLLWFSISMAFAACNLRSDKAA